MSGVVLPVNSSKWRTWPGKKLLPEQQGEWRVEVRDTKGNLLKSLQFALL